MADTQTLISNLSKPARRAFKNEHERSLTQLMREVQEYLPHDEIEFVKSAYEYAHLAHYGQTRKSGEPYIVHPVSVSLRLARLRLTADLIVAGLLHDTVEDCGIEVEDLRRQFGDVVALLVDGVTKLKHIELRAIENGNQKRR